MRTWLAILIATAAVAVSHAMPPSQQVIIFGKQSSASSGGGFTPTTFDTGTLSSATLSNSNLTATHTSGVGGARSVSYKSSGKYYFEITVGSSHGNTDNVSVSASTYSYSAMAGGSNGDAVQCWLNFTSFSQLGPLLAGNSYGSRGLGATPAAGGVIGIAVDLNNFETWWRLNNGNWNNDPTANPATNTGGQAFNAHDSYSPSVVFSSSSSTGDNFTANFGGSAFSGAVPSGFTAGWPQ